MGNIFGTNSEAARDTSEWANIWSPVPDPDQILKTTVEGCTRMYMRARVCVEEGAGGVQRITAIRPEAYDAERVRVQRYAVLVI